MSSPEVLVVGGGPGGAAAGFWLARAGHDVMVVEKKHYPRDKTCGDGLTPRAIYHLIEMGFDFSMAEFHEIEGLRAYAGDRMLELPWPEHTRYPNWGGMIRRADLDGQLAALAEKEGAVIRQGTEAKAVVDDGRLTAVELAVNGSVERIQPKIVVVADGSLSRFGRALGAYREKAKPFGLAARGYFHSPNASDRYLESHLGIPDQAGRAVAGYGWVFPLGDGTVNVGVGVMSTFKGWKELNTTTLMESFLPALPGYWEIGPDSAIGKATGGKLPMSLSVGPKVGPNWILIGDAAGAINPFTGEGIDYAFETARMAAPHIGDALASDDLTRLHSYVDELDQAFESYNRVARAFLNLIGTPAVMHTLTRTGMRFRPVMSLVLKIMANLVDPEDPRRSEHAYSLVERLVEAGPRP